MRITCVGVAGGEVTGSGFIIQTKNARILVDCGMFQGGKKSEALNRPPLGPRQRLDAVLITRAHLDHSGRLPLLSKMGYTGPVYSTKATAEMSALIVRDSASIQAADAERRNRKRMRAGEDPVEPLYGPEDAENIIGRFKTVDYEDDSRHALAALIRRDHGMGSTLPKWGESITLYTPCAREDPLDAITAINPFHELTKALAPSF